MQHVIEENGITVGNSPAADFASAQAYKNVTGCLAPAPRHKQLRVNVILAAEPLD